MKKKHSISILTNLTDTEVTIKDKIIRVKKK